MFFRIIGIKEAQGKKYNIDILIEWESESIVREFLQYYNIILLNISKYENSKDSFWKIELTIKHKNQNIAIISYLTDIKIVVFTFFMVWFDVIYANFIDQNKLPDEEVSNIIKEIYTQVEQDQQQVKQIVNQDKENEKKIYKDEKLDKIVKIAQEEFWQIELLLQKVWDKVSRDKIRDLNVMGQELVKLKMWRNDDKMAELLEKIYAKSDEIETEYLEYMQQHIYYPIPNSVVSNIDIITENQKYKKAQKIKEIWASRDADDNYYLSFDSAWLYIRLLLKDIKNNIQNLSWFFYNLFDYIQLSAIFLIVYTAFILWTQNIYPPLSDSLYNYVFLIHISVFGLILFYAQKLKKESMHRNIFLILTSIIISIILFRLLKVNFAF